MTNMRLGRLAFALLLLFITSKECTLVCAPFDGDMAFFEQLSIEQGSGVCVIVFARLGGSTMKCEVCYGDVLQKARRDGMNQ